MLRGRWALVIAGVAAGVLLGFLGASRWLPTADAQRGAPAGVEASGAETRPAAGVLRCGCDADREGHVLPPPMAADRMDGVQVFCRSYYHIPDPRKSIIELIFTNCGDQEVELSGMHGLGFSEYAGPHPRLAEAHRRGRNGEGLGRYGPGSARYLGEGAWEWVYGGPKLAPGESGILRARGVFEGRAVPSTWTVSGRYVLNQAGEAIYEEGFEFSMSFPGFQYSKSDVLMCDGPP